MKVIVTGSQGFIGSYICNELLSNGHSVIGIDNYSKYGRITRSHDTHPNFKLHTMDIIDLYKKMDESEYDDLRDADYLIAGAALIGGISYFHEKAFDLLATNEEILASTFRTAIKLHKNHALKRIVVISSSMVFEQTSRYPTPETEVLTCPPPLSTYGFQKLASEYFCKGAWEQYKLPYTIIRPFNCIGLGETRTLDAHEISHGNIKLMLSHVLPDLINKALRLRQDEPLPILGKGDQVRHYTHGKDIARGIRIAMESPQAENNDFNISHPRPMTVLELADVVWRKIHGTELRVVSHPAYEYDVQIRSPDVTKARVVLGFSAEISVEESIDEIIEWMRTQI
jgi:nucleoside-diphosphate-sugar epimerase